MHVTLRRNCSETVTVKHSFSLTSRTNVTFVQKYYELSPRRKKVLGHDPRTVPFYIIPYRCKVSNPHPSNPFVHVPSLGHAAVNQNTVCRYSPQNHPRSNSMTHIKVQIYQTSPKFWSIAISIQYAVVSNLS